MILLYNKIHITQNTNERFKRSRNRIVKKINLKRRKLRFYLLIIGIIIIFLGSLLFLLGIDFNITISGYNLTLFIDILIIIMGANLASKYLIAPYDLKEKLSWKERVTRF